jgi:serine protease Do
VSSVEKDGPAAKAGVQPGDVILKVNGNEISRSNDLPLLVANLKPDSTAQMEVWRKGASKELTVKVAEMKPAKTAEAKTDKPHGQLGLAVRPLNPDEQKEAGVHGGLLVEDASGPAAKAGIEAGDIILALNGTPVKSAGELRGLVERSGKQTIALLVQREDTKIFVPIDLG